jgi:hypothetical protein
MHDNLGVHIIGYLLDNADSDALDQVRVQGGE